LDNVVALPARSWTILAALLIAVAMPGVAAGASTYSRVLRSYQNRGSIPPCQFSSGQLETALKSVDTYGAQYFADFTAAIQTALAARASGACATNGTTTPAPTTGGGGPTESPSFAKPVTAATGAGVPAPIVVLAALAALFALVGVVAGVGHLRGWDPVWAEGWRHQWAEAGYRVGGTWAEFLDWLRSRS
jgi:hypothetical protein